MALTMDLPTAEEAASSGGTFLNKPGKYHGVIMLAEENAMRGEKMVKGFMFEVAAHGVEKGNEEEIGKTIKLYFGNPDASHKDGGKFSLSKQTAALIASNAIAPADLGKKGVSVDVEACKNHQVMFEIELSKPDANQKRWPDLAYANIYHIDDPRAKSWPKNAEILELAKDFRRQESFFESIIKAKPAPQQKVTDSDLEGL
jgi:hypothetical protein